MDSFMAALLLLSPLFFCSVESQSAMEIVKSLKGQIKDEYFPNLSCPPYGWDKNLHNVDFSSEEAMKNPESFVEKHGLKGLHKLHQITSQCDKELMNDKKIQKLHVDSPNNGFCHKSCILEKLGLLKSKWTEKYLIMGKFGEALSSVKELLTRKPTSSVYNISLDLYVESFVRYVFLAHENLEDYAGNQTCYEVDDWIWPLLKFIFNDCPGKTSGWKSETFERWPVEIEFLQKGASWKEWVSKMSLPIWPNVKTLKAWNVTPPADLDKFLFSREAYAYVISSGTAWEFYQNWKDCRNKYNMTAFKKERGEFAAESCAKTCVLHKLHVLEFSSSEIQNQVTLYDRYFSLRTFAEYEQKSSKLFHPGEDQEFSKAYVSKVQSKLFKAVQNAMNANKFPVDTVCHDSRWKSVFKAVDCVFEDTAACQGG